MTPSERLAVGIIGMGGRGNAHLSALIGNTWVRLPAVKAQYPDAERSFNACKPLSPPR